LLPNLPSALIELEAEPTFNTFQLIEACSLTGRAFRVVSPEPGVVYAASEKGTSPNQWAGDVRRLLPGPRLALGLLQARMQGVAHFVRPITLLDIPQEVLLKLLFGEVLLCTFIDLAYLEKALNEHDLPVVITNPDNAAGLSLRIPPVPPRPAIEVGRGLIQSVAYGAQSLASAIGQMVELHTRFLQDFAFDENGSSEPGDA
jgi:hypothetical protein